LFELGYKLSSEEHRPSDLVRYARRAEETGFRFAAISDHFHPWIDKQWQNPFAWAVLGAIARSTAKKTSSTVRYTALTCAATIF
jgi:coenzyme F420-dependent glucose-6-phosphate dehydrogenase